MKRFIAAFICTAILCCSFGICGIAYDQPMVDVWSVEAKPGETVEMTITLENNTGFSNLSLEIDYDSAALTLIEAEPVSSVGGSFTAAQELSVRPYNMQWDNAGDITYNGELAVLTFEVSETAEGTYPITVDYYKGRNGDNIPGEDINYNAAFDPLEILYSSGTVRVTGGSVSPTLPPAPEQKGITVNIGDKTAKLEASELSGVVIIGVYDNKNSLVRAEVNKADREINIDKLQSGEYAKIMWWEDIEGLRPMCDAVTIE